MNDIDGHIQRTNKRLQAICAQLSSASNVEFSEAAVELLQWCDDSRAFRAEFEENLLHCLATLQHACLQSDFQLDLAYRVISTCFRHRDLFSNTSATQLTQWCEKLGRLVVLKEQKQVAAANSTSMSSATSSSNPRRSSNYYSAATNHRRVELEQAASAQPSVNHSARIEQSPRLRAAHFISTSHRQRYSPYSMPFANMMYKHSNSGGVLPAETNHVNVVGANPLLMVEREQRCPLNSGLKCASDTMGVVSAPQGSYHLNMQYGEQFGISSTRPPFNSPPVSCSASFFQDLGYQQLGFQKHSDDDMHHLRLNINVRDGMLLVPFRIEHNLAVSNHAFNLNENMYSTLMTYPDMELQFKSFHHNDHDMNCNWPSCLSVTVNNQPLTLDRSLSSRQPDNALFIKKLCHPGKNTIQLGVTACCCTHLFMLQMIHRPSVRSVVHDLWRKRKLSADLCISKIQNIMLDDKKSAASIEPFSTRLSLKCPISSRRIMFPTRGHECQHVQCFDLESFLRINAIYNSWRCPCCSKHAALEGLEIDEYFFGILESVDAVIEEVFMDSTSRWSAAPLMKSDSHSLVVQNDTKWNSNINFTDNTIQRGGKEVFASEFASLTKYNKNIVLNTCISFSSGPPSAPPAIISSSMNDGTMVTTMSRQRPASAAPSAIIDLLSPQLTGAVSNDNLSDFTLASLESADLSDIGTTDLGNLPDFSTLGDAGELLSYL